VHAPLFAAALYAAVRPFGELGIGDILRFGDSSQASQPFPTKLVLYFIQ